MKSFLIIGMGRFGSHLCQNLAKLGNEVMIIDQNEELLEPLLPYVTDAKIGDCTKEEVLKSLGVGNFDKCIVCVGTNFQSSLEITCLLKELGAKYVVSKATRDVHAKFLLRNGADEIVYPEKQLASWTAIRYSSDHVFDYVEIDGDYAIFEVSVPKSWIGKTVGQIDIRRRYNINILAIRTNGKLCPDISADTPMPESSTILVLGLYSSMHKCFHI